MGGCWGEKCVGEWRSELGVSGRRCVGVSGGRGARVSRRVGVGVSGREGVGVSGRGLWGRVVEDWCGSVSGGRVVWECK